VEDADFMRKIRLSEMVILKEEETHGCFCRDPDDRIVPRVQVILSVNIESF
jgi:hypothetical protein